MLNIPFAYVGPGAGFAFLGSFFSILLSLLAGIASLLLWPFRALVRLFRGQRIRERVILLEIDGLDQGRMEQLISAGRLSHRSLRATSSDRWFPSGFWKALAGHGVDSTVLLVPGEFPGADFKGRRLWRSANGELISQPSYYAKYLARLLGPLPEQPEALLFSALEHQQRGVLACAMSIPDASGEALGSIIDRLLSHLDEATTLLIFSSQGALFSNRAIDAKLQTLDDLAPAILRIFGFA